MPFIRSADAVVHETHGSRFVSYATPAAGSRQLSAWRLEVPAGTAGVPHTVNGEEVLYLLAGDLRFTVDGEVAELTAGDTVVVPAGSRLCVDNVGGATAMVWTATPTGLTATLADGTVISPPWAN